MRESQAAIDQSGERSCGIGSASKLVWGLGLIGVGALMMGDKLDLVELGSYWQFWPALLILAGAASLADSLRGGGGADGIGLIAAGAPLLLHTQRVLHLRDSWPLFLVVVGFSMILSPGRRRRRRHRDGD